MTVVTDIHVHGMWLADPCDHYFVATDQGRETLERSGVRRERITVSGIPIDPVFAQAPSTADGRRAVRTEARTRLGLPADRPVVLFTTGGACVGPIEALYRHLLTLKTPCELVAICGKSVSAREALERIAAQHVVQSPPGSAVRTQVLGHTTAMHDYMAAADLLIGKPGGLTSAEARASGLPMAIVHAIPGQEEHNATALTNAGCAVRCDTEALNAAVQTIDRLLQSPDERNAMAERARAGAAPGSADVVAMAVARYAQARGVR